MSTRALALLALLALASCSSEPDPKPGVQDDDPGDEGDDGGDDGGSPEDGIFGVEQSVSFSVEGLSCPAEVVRTEGNVPHIYAHDREDLAFATGFVFAQDRFFFLDLARRLALGRVSEILGDPALESDKQARASGMTHVARTLAANLSDEQRAHMAAYAAGVNAYIAEVEAGRLPPPSELVVAGGLLGAEEPTDLMEPFTVDDLAGAMASLVYELGYETGDVGDTRKAELASTGVYDDGTAFHDLREEAAVTDVYRNIAPYYDHVSAPDWDPGPAPVARGPLLLPGSPVPLSMLDRLEARLTRFEKRLRHDNTVVWGSNSWAVMGSETTDGRAILAGDGHLPLTVPSLFWQVGLDTSLLGGGDTTQLGLGLPGLPYMAVGTNGRVAWSQTQLGGDITDWFAEELQLDDDGAPAATLFQGEWLPLTVLTEDIVIADVPVMGSVGRTETFQRWETSDGRWLMEIEGTPVDCDSEAEAGSTVVDLQGDCVVPGDTDGDGTISAISFDYTGLDPLGVFHSLDGWGHADSVEEMQELARGLVAYSQNIVAADASGSVLYTSYQAIPCRADLPRSADGTWAPGADPNQLLDGTTYGGFEVVIDDAGMVDDSFPPDDRRCMLPLDEVPHSIDPPQGWVATANNDPGGYALDGVLENSGTYIGGPWDGGARMHRISELLDEDRGAHSLDTMIALQDDHQSPFGRILVPHLLAAIDRARTFSETDGPLTEDEGRMVDVYNENLERFTEVRERLQGWSDRGFIAHSGVETFYNLPTDEEIEDSVATTIFNAWKGQLADLALGDEAAMQLSRTGGTHGRMRVMKQMLEARGPEAADAVAGWLDETEESVFWDVLGTEEVERSDEVMLLSLEAALDLLSGPATGDAEGGFDTEDMGQWRWGMRHLVKFESVLAEFLGDDPTFSFLTDQFAITPDRLPIAEGLSSDDPRAALPWYPRPGDTESVDASNFGWNTSRFTYGSGPVFRMVIALGPGGVSGVNILPGGQSALTDSPHFDDQAALWLGNETWPLRFTEAEVVAGATGRESLRPADGSTCE